MTTAQLSLDFTAIAQAEEQTYPIAYLEKAQKTYSACTLSEKNRIRGIFHHLGSPHFCTGCLFNHGLAEVYLSRLYSPAEWQLQQHLTPDNEPCFYWGREIQHKGQTWIMGDRITLYPDPKERAIAIAQSQIQWGERRIEMLTPILAGEHHDPFYPLDYYEEQLKQAEQSLKDGKAALKALTGVTR